MRPETGAGRSVAGVFCELVIKGARHGKSILQFVLGRVGVVDLHLAAGVGAASAAVTKDARDIICETRIVRVWLWDGRGRSLSRAGAQHGEAVVRCVKAAGCKFGGDSWWLK